MPSVGSVGGCHDNVLAETINGFNKAEVIHRRGFWRSFEAVEFVCGDLPVGWLRSRQIAPELLAKISGLGARDFAVCSKSICGRTGQQLFPLHWTLENLRYRFE
jgi:hypothetical protein